MGDEIQLPLFNLFFDGRWNRKGRQLQTLYLMQRSSLLCTVWESYNANLILEVILLKESEIKILANITR